MGVREWQTKKSGHYKYNSVNGVQRTCINNLFSTFVLKLWDEQH